MPQVLITGGNGFIGRAVKRFLRNKYPDWTIRSLDLTALGADVDADGIEHHAGTILDLDDVSRAMRGCDTVVHLAAQLGVQRTEAAPLRCLNVNIHGTINILEGCVKERVKRIVFSSSSEVYGDTADRAISETAFVSPRSVYATSKLAGEYYVQAYLNRYGLEYTILRFFNVYGPGQITEFVIPRFVDAVSRGEPPVVYGTGEQVRAFCHVNDAAQGVASALVSPRAANEVFNIGNHREPICMKDLAAKVVELSGNGVAPRFVPMTESDRMPGREIFRRLPDIGKAAQTLHYEPAVSLTEGLRELLAQAKERRSSS